MLLPRIIPCLLIHNKGLVKTIRFKNPKYVGDPINAVKIFNEKYVDELVVLDIDASVQKHEPNYKLIRDLAVECRMPLCYGGGIKNINHATNVFNLGVEKIALSSCAVENPEEIPKIIDAVGSQSIVIVIDVFKKRFGNKFEIAINNGSKKTGIDPFEFVLELEKLGIGELIINSIDNDGTMAGYNTILLEKIRELISIPITILGGAGNLKDLGEIVNRYGAIGVAAGSYFVFKGRFRAVLINYPTEIEKNQFYETYLKEYNRLK